jgi:hypothetical protein
MYDDQKRTIDFASNYFDPTLTNAVDGHCQIFLDVYPTNEFKNGYATSLPITFTVVIGTLFVFMAMIFAVYDRYVLVLLRYGNMLEAFFFLLFLSRQYSNHQVNNNLTDNIIIYLIC